MDSLIVLRKTLRPSQMAPKYKIPKKTKKPTMVPKVDPIPPEPGLEDMVQYEPPISFVKLYKELCIANALAACAAEPLVVQHLNSPVASSTSLVTRYRGYSRRDSAAPHALPTTDVVLELDYGHSFKTIDLE